MLFSYSVIYRAIASEPLFGQFLTAGCSEIDPSPYRCVRCLLEDLCTTMVDTIERSTPKSKADRSNIIETRYQKRSMHRMGGGSITVQTAVRACADRSWSAGRPGLPAVAGSGFPHGSPRRGLLAN